MILLFVLALLLMALGPYVGIEFAKAKADHKLPSLWGVLGALLGIFLVFILYQLSLAYLSVQLTDDTRHSSAIYRLGKEFFATDTDATGTDADTTCCFWEEKQ